MERSSETMPPSSIRTQQNWIAKSCIISPGHRADEIEAIIQNGRYFWALTASKDLIGQRRAFCSA